MLHDFFSPKKSFYYPEVSTHKQLKTLVLQETTRGQFYGDGIRNWAWHCVVQWVIDTALSRIQSFDIAFTEYMADFESYLLEIDALPPAIDVYGTPIDNSRMFVRQTTQILETYESVIRLWTNKLFELDEAKEPTVMGNVNSVHLHLNKGYITVFIFVEYYHLLEHKKDG